MDLKHHIAINKFELNAFIIIFLVVAGLVFGSRVLRLNSSSAIMFNDKTEIFIHENSSIDYVMYVFDSHGIDYNKNELIWASNLLGWRNFQRGRYSFQGSFSYNDLLSKMAKGMQDLVSVTVPPGSTIQRLASRISQNLHFEPEDFLTVFTDSAYLEEIGLNEQQLLGRMHPETYSMYWTSSPKTAINKILREFDQSYTQEMNQRTRELDLNVDEILTLASIIEWEANIENEKERISGLYWNRLNKRMYLQADPTINYAIGERRRLLYEDYLIDHPFNTYKNYGLPPAAITNPSMSSILAALYPEDHDFLYMVANPEGGHVFTKTFKEHQVESEKWRKWLREQYQIKRQREAEAKMKILESETN